MAKKTTNIKHVIATRFTDYVLKHGTYPKSVYAFTEEIEIKEADFYVLKHTDCPAILIEMGFLTNAKDQSYLTSTSGQAEIAKTIFESIRN